ncbi:T9SS type A sorting domain-containing protein [Mariniflexile sp. HNIBRBA6329]|uniref:T9SS type A sorting domain-containing protein n=1 Tax=Mariniflexile sp. HNIBRBA6329 TaxID=3373088 RepID=UPI003745E945
MKNFNFRVYFRKLILFSAYMCILNLNGQIIYTDIEPDFEANKVGDNYNLDLNNDGIIDFILNTSYYDYYWFEIRSTNNFNGIITVQPWYSNALPLDSGKEVFTLSGYKNGEIYEKWGLFTVGDCFAGEYECFYNWKNKGDKYLGLRFLVNGQIHYGWVRLDVISYVHWVIKDYAYNTISNTPILTGQIVLGLEKQNYQKFKLVVINRQILIVNLNDNFKYSIYSIEGQEIFCGNIKSNDERIDVQALASGVYIIKLWSLNDSYHFQRKFIIP